MEKAERVETPWRKMGIGFGGIGILFFLINIFQHFIEKETDFFMEGVIWIIIGAIFLIKTYLDEKRLKNIQKNCKVYDGEIIRIIPCNKSKARVGRYFAAQIECRYLEGGTYRTIKSGSFLFLNFHDKMENFFVKIYIDDKGKKVVDLYRYKSAD